MDPNISSIFDLTPPEKLQLVEDLWDDLAATPDAVPIHDWQKEELARRKANLMSNPAAGLTWDERAAHSAVYDAEITAELFCEIVNRFRPIYEAVPPLATPPGTDGYRSGA